MATILAAFVLGGCVLLGAYFIDRNLTRSALNPREKLKVEWPLQRVLITGGSNGIGAELVQNLQALGATIMIMDISPPSFNLGESFSLRY